MGKQSIMFYEILLNTITKMFTLLLYNKNEYLCLSHVEKITEILGFLYYEF